MTNEEAQVFLDNLIICVNEHPVVADWLVEIANRKTEPQIKCPKCGRSDYIRSFKDWGIDGGIYKYKCINCNTYIKDEPSCDTCKLKDTTEWCKRQEVCRAYQPKDEPQ
jgi:transposase-like protein